MFDVSVVVVVCVDETFTVVMAVVVVGASAVVIGAVEIMVVVTVVIVVVVVVIVVVAVVVVLVADVVVGCALVPSDVMFFLHTSSISGLACVIIMAQNNLL